MHHRSRRVRLVSAITLIGCLMGAVTAAPMAANAADVAAPRAVPTPGDPVHGVRELLTVRPPVDNSVTVTQQGLTVYATPRCSADFKQCSTWVEIPDLNISRRPVSTTGGYTIPWPAGWAPGTGHSVVVHSYAQNVFGYWYYSTEDTPAGFAYRSFAVLPLTAAESTHDEAGRNATISGTATPFADIRRDGVHVATADGEGRWSERVTGLPIGSTTLRYLQYVDGTYEDQTSVTVQFTQPVVNGGLADGDSPSVALARGGRTRVDHVVRATADFGSFSGRVEVDAPDGTTFGSGQGTVQGQVRTGGTGSWDDADRLVLTDGTLSADRKQMTFAWRATGGAFRNGEEYRFGFGVDTPADAPAGTTTMAFRLRGFTDRGSSTVDGQTATTLAPVQVENGGFAPLGVGFPSEVPKGGSADVSIGLVATADITSMQGTTVQLHAPEGTFFTGPQTLVGSYRTGSSGSWTPTPSLTATGTVSPDGKTLTATVAPTGPSFKLSGGWQVRWTATITAK